MKPTNEKQTHSLNLCRGAAGKGCPHAVPMADDFACRLEREVLDSGWPEFIRGIYGDRLHRHHGFQVHVSACPNGCSRPHIADMGLIRASEPLLHPEECTSCGECAEACPDQAITMADGLPVVDRSLCLRCEACVRACLADAMQGARQGWRVVAGGRLGRHPTLASELPGLYDDGAAVALLARALRLFMDNYEPGKRFGRVLDDLGLDRLTADGE